MATSALSGAVRRSSRVRIGFRSLIRVACSAECNPSSRSRINVPWAVLLNHNGVRSRCAVAAVTDRENGGKWSTVNLGFRILGASVAAVGLQVLSDDDVVFSDAHELGQSVALESADESVVTAKEFSLLTESYRRQVFFRYERRLRLRSRPEKVFGYFASHRDPLGHLYMTPADLMRALVPVFPPTGSIILREGHLQGERAPGDLFCSPSEFFMLFDTNSDGLISFAEYLLFTILISIPGNEFKAAFKMFDLNGDGKIQRDEFREVMKGMRERMRHSLQQPSTLSTALFGPTAVENGGLLEHFFGVDGKKELRLEDFTDFLRKLHVEMTRLEFAHYDFKRRGSITAYDFGLSVVASADIDRLTEYLDRVAPLLTDPQYKDLRISPEEFNQYAELRQKRRKLALAMSTYGKMNKADFQRAASQVCNVSLSSTLVDVIFQIFDTNRDGHLSNEEFLHVMDKREREIANPMDTGLVRTVKCWWRCSQDCGNLQQHWRV